MQGLSAAPENQWALFDNIVVAYIVAPLFVFLVGWFEPLIAVPLVALTAYGLGPWPSWVRSSGPASSLTPAQVALAIIIGLAWAIMGGAQHWFFANADWHIRDAVLHDLVTAHWPVGYGLVDGKESLLRAPLAYFLPAAVLGKLTDLGVAHFAMAIWTAAGASLFLMQVLSIERISLRVSWVFVVTIVLFSGLDIVGALLQGGPHFRAWWNITTHLEWWARFYQYSSMTTQLFWVPNHALCAWLTIGLLSRHDANGPLNPKLAMLVVAGALWSPLSALGTIPFVLWRLTKPFCRAHLRPLLRPHYWMPALIVGMAVSAYLGLDTGEIPRNWTYNLVQEGLPLAVARQFQFFLLEAGFIGMATVWIRRSSDVLLALAILAVLPVVSFGPANDLVMRTSIPSLAMLCIGACRALNTRLASPDEFGKKATLFALLAVGAITPLQEFARAVIVPAWPINFQATLVGADCGRYPQHYIARLSHQPALMLLKRPWQLPLGDTGPASCLNPAESALERREEASARDKGLQP